MKIVKVIGIPWYREEDYDQLRAMFDDGVKLPDTYAAWLVRAEKGLEESRAQGFRAVKVNLDPHEFTVWCREHGQKLDAAARIRFAGERAHAIVTGN
jgi:hypothetical protein